MLTSFVSLKGLQRLKKIGISAEIRTWLIWTLAHWASKHEKLLAQEENVVVRDQQIRQMGGEFFQG